MALLDSFYGTRVLFGLPAILTVTHMLALHLDHQGKSDWRLGSAQEGRAPPPKITWQPKELPKP